VSSEGLRSWWLALAAVAVCGPWPGWLPSGPAVAVVAAGMMVLARPHGRQLWPWAAVALAVGIVAWPEAPAPTADDLARHLDHHCEGLLDLAESAAARPELQRLFAASGEALDPALPFAVLAGQIGARAGRTIYLADDRGRLVAWAGEERAFPHGVRPLGQRRWGLAWSAGSATLFVREPLLVEGRLVGSLTVADRSELQATTIFGMTAPTGSMLRIGRGVPGAVDVEAPRRPSVSVPVAVVAAGPLPPRTVVWLPWVVLVALALVMAPRVAWLAVIVAGLAFAAQPGRATPVAGGVVLLVGAIAVFRAVGGLRPDRARWVIAAVGSSCAALALVGPHPFADAWLPSHLLRPGWGGVWVMSLAVVAARWPSRGAHGTSSLARRLGIAAVVAGLALGIELVRLPLALWQVGRGGPAVEQGSTIVLPRGETVLGGGLPAPPEECRVDDLAPVLARAWGLPQWTTPSQLILVDGRGLELSRWGDLGPAGDAVRVVRRWDLAPDLDGTLELLVAAPPWAWLSDWQTGFGPGGPVSGQLWYAVLTRSGEVAASIRAGIRGLDAMTAGDLFHADGGWVWMTVKDSRQLARVWREGDWLVAAIARSPALPVWVVQVALAMLWALVGLVLAQPPTLGRGQLTTFGGRLRLLVTGGVVLPLIILTLFLNQMLRREGRRIDHVAGTDALRAARYTVVNLAGGVPVDDELARWLSNLVGGDVVLFDGAWVAAVSRPDLLASTALPELPVAAVFPRFLLGRDDPLVLRHNGRLVAAGGVVLQGRRLLMQLYPVDPMLDQATPEAVDWLLTGAVLSALLALVLTSRVEQRLFASLRDLVTLARELLHGEPVGAIRRPRETDLAEVIDAVRSMNEQVQQRELSLRDQEELLRITLSTLKPAVVVLGSDNEVRFSNPSAEELLGEHEQRVLSLIQEVGQQATEAGSAHVETVQPVPGRELTWRIGAAGVPLPHGRRGLVGVVDDVTDVVRVDRLRQLTQLARIVAHEVKNPLTPIRLWVQELEEARGRRDPALVDMLAEACAEIARQVERLQATASSFSNLVALEHWEAEEVDVVELAAEALADLAILERRGVQLGLESRPDGSFRVTADRQWLRRALDNLLKNSVDALGESSGTISLRVDSGVEVVVLEVEDTAGGVPASQLQDLFSPHFSTTSSGSGLGLALVHHVVSRCQGTVVARNAKHGLHVTIELPRSRGDSA
jgi:signal transduction histidine kinase